MTLALTITPQNAGYDQSQAILAWWSTLATIGTIDAWIDAEISPAILEVLATLSTNYRGGVDRQMDTEADLKRTSAAASQKILEDLATLSTIASL